MLKFCILVVDDNPLASKVMEAHLKDHDSEYAVDFTGAKRKIEETDYDLVFIDLKLGETDERCCGLDLIALAKSRGMYCVVMSGQDCEAYVEKAYELGCDDFYAKGNEETNIQEVLKKYVIRTQRAAQQKIFSENFITQDQETRLKIQEVLGFAPSPLPILILGPSGTGKTSLARLIHDGSGRTGPFIAINCSSYTDDLLEAELFGYKKGAFTGAQENRKGKLLLADQGTLFLDEIGTISAKMQTKLLKAIEEKTFYPLGSEHPQSSNFRIISATLEDVAALVHQKKLRFDFFQRIHGYTITLKPLAGRRGDIFPLISFFTRQGKRLAWTPEAKGHILNYSWPGNVRELKKFVDLLSASGVGLVDRQIAAQHLTALRLKEDSSLFATEEQIQFALQEGMAAATERFRDAVIANVIERNAGKRTQAMKELGISPRQLYLSLRRQGKSIRTFSSHTHEGHEHENQLTPAA